MSQEAVKRKYRILKPPCGLHCIKMNDIGVRIGRETIIEHVNLHIHCGKLTVLIGRNGAGKSTLIKAILGEVRHTGTIEFRDMRDKSVHDLWVGYVPQHLNFEKNTPTSVYDMFASYISNVPVFLKRTKALRERIHQSLSMFEAQGLLDKQLGDLSGVNCSACCSRLRVTQSRICCCSMSPFPASTATEWSFFTKISMP